MQCVWDQPCSEQQGGMVRAEFAVDAAAVAVVVDAGAAHFSCIAGKRKASGFGD